MALAQRTRKVHESLNAQTLDAFCSIKPLSSVTYSAKTAAALATTPLAGMPIAVKEIMDVAGEVCAYGCDAFAGRIPNKSCDIVQRLEVLGAKVIGITRSTELAIARITSTINPFDNKRSPGASSSGSAAAVGAGLVPFALGSQTIGSTIRPAAYCNVVGFKPTHNMISLQGIMPLSPTLDHIGLLACSVTQLVAVASQLDNALIPTKDEYSRFLFASPWYSDSVDDTVTDAINDLRGKLQLAGYGCDDWSVDEQVAVREAAVCQTILVREMADHWYARLHNHSLVSDGLKQLLREGQQVSQTHYEEALSEREAIIQTLQQTLESNDIVVSPAVTGIPPLLADGTGSRDPQRLWTLAGMPAISLPLSKHKGLPRAVQITAARGEDHHLLGSALALERLLSK